MKVKFTTSANCLGSYDEVILSSGNSIKTAAALLNKWRVASGKLNYWRKQSPNYPFYMFVNEVRVKMFIFSGTKEDVQEFIDRHNCA
jgi:hypothetical protein